MYNGQSYKSSCEKVQQKKKVDKYPSYTTVGRIVTVWNSLTEAQF